MKMKYKDKEINLVPRTRKVIELTEKLKGKNLNDVMFQGLKNCDIKVLAEIIKAFAEDEDKKAVFTSINNVYDFIDELKETEQKSYSEIYKEVIEVTNEMGFFSKKMTPKELNAQIEDPISNIDMEELVKASAQKYMDKLAEEEFGGYQG